MLFTLENEICSEDVSCKKHHKSGAAIKLPSPQIYYIINSQAIPLMMEDYRISVSGTIYTPGKVLCIGRNYAKHAKELGNDVPSEPMVFLKPASALVASGGAVVLHPMTNEVHHEVELVCLIGRRGKNISEEDALSYVQGYAVGLDMTARDLQSKAKAKGHPWSVAKGLDTFAPLGDFVASGDIMDPQVLPIQLTINGEVKQAGNTSDMIFPVARLISWCSHVFTLEPGDLLFTGTPDGVGPVVEGDQLVAEIPGLPPLKVSVAR